RRLRPAAARDRLVLLVPPRKLFDHLRGAGPGHPVPHPVGVVPAGSREHRSDLRAFRGPPGQGLRGRRDMSASPRLSVLMPTYNAAAHLPATLDALMQQTFTDFEVLLVDDCSTDNTREVV